MKLYGLFLLLGLGALQGQQIPFDSSRVTVDPTPLVVRAGDFNHDRIQDVAVLCLQSIVILLGKGDGTFQAPVPAISPNRRLLRLVATFADSTLCRYAVLDRDAAFDSKVRTRDVLYLGSKPRREPRITQARGVKEQDGIF